MKTIKQAAKEYRNTLSSYDYENAIGEEGFLKGIEFAQQWISVKDELPDNNRIVLVKTGSVYDLDYAGNAFLAWYLEAYDEWILKKTPKSDIGEVITDITHWRDMTKK